MTIATEGIARESWFRGRWQMVRIIEDVTEGVIGEFWGACTFSPDGEGLTCRETGVLRFRGEDYAASRVSLWRFPGGGRIEVRYEDGRPFHDFDEGRPEARHLCSEDAYRVSYEFAQNGWLSRWEVSGPRKDYVMITRYRRESADHAGSTVA
jgi:hypothetical protein